VTGFELSAFYEGLETTEVVASEGDILDQFTWLSVSDHVMEELPPASEETRAFHVELMGRKSLCAAGYGHLGAAPHEIIVSKFLKMDRVPIKMD
jgi:hypothetical protein